MNKLKSPCKGCELRHLYCHRSCRDFLEFRENVEYVGAKKHEDTKIQEDYMGVVTHRERMRSR